jgi:hypothetical protein
MTTDQHTITIPGLPKGWRAVAYRIPVKDVDWILFGGHVVKCDFNPLTGEYLIVEKIPRLTIERTEKNFEEGDSGHAVINNHIIYIDRASYERTGLKIWRVVESTEK